MAQASAGAKRILSGQEGAGGEDPWAAVRPLMQAEDDATYEALRRAFLEGIPRRPVSAERADAERLFKVLARIGGERLLGPVAELPPGLYWGEGRAS
jgi:NitT/TauT family transport system substrate-binding protein